MKILLTILLVALLAVRGRLLDLVRRGGRSAAVPHPARHPRRSADRRQRHGNRRTGRDRRRRRQIVGMIKSFGPDAIGRARPSTTIPASRKATCWPSSTTCPTRPSWRRPLPACGWPRPRSSRTGPSRSRRNATSIAPRDSARTRTRWPSDYESAKSQYEIAEAELAMSEAKVEQAKVAKKQAEINLEYTTIRSPVDGTVIARRVNVGQTVVAELNAPSLFLLAKDLSRMLVWAAVNEADIGDIHVGQKVTFKVDAYRDQTFTGKVSQIRLDASLVASVVTYRRGRRRGQHRRQADALHDRQAPVRGGPAVRRAAGSRPGPALAADLGADHALGPGRPALARPAQIAAGERTRKPKAKATNRPSRSPRPRSGSAPTTAWSVPCPSSWDSPTAWTPS